MHVTSSSHTHMAYIYIYIYIYIYVHILGPPHSLSVIVRCLRTRAIYIYIYMHMCIRMTFFNQSPDLPTTLARLDKHLPTTPDPPTTLARLDRHLADHSTRPITALIANINAFSLGALPKCHVRTVFYHLVTWPSNPPLLGQLKCPLASSKDNIGLGDRVLCHLSCLFEELSVSPFLPYLKLLWPF